MGKVISVINFKGGVGKTTFAVNLAGCLAEYYDQKTLLIDLDAQSNSTVWLAGEVRLKEINTKEYEPKTAKSLFTKNFDFSHILQPFSSPQHDYLPNLHFLPASYYMMTLENDIHDRAGIQRLTGTYRKNSEFQLLRRPVAGLRRDFKFTIMDCPPNLFAVTQNALDCSDCVLVPCTPEQLSVFGLRILIDHLEKTQRVCRLKESDDGSMIVGIVLNKVRVTKDHEAGMEAIRRIVDDKKGAGTPLGLGNRVTLFDSYRIRDRILHAEAVKAERPLCLHRPLSDAYGDIKAVTEAILHEIGS
ncbi:MAG: ParA family protein [Thermodesulfobacteriota bacterium]